MVATGSQNLQLVQNEGDWPDRVLGFLLASDWALLSADEFQC